MRKPPHLPIKLACLFLLIVFILSSCNFPYRAKFETVITSHLDGQSVVLNQETRIVSFTTSTAGIESIQLLIDGRLTHTEYPPVGNPVELTANQPWVPTQVGNAIITIIATDTRGNVSDPVNITLQVVPSVSQIEATITPTPTVTPEGLSLTQTAQSGCSNDLNFISHITFPPNTYVTAGSNFTKVWQVSNNGTCDWIGYQLVHASGDVLGANSPDAIPVVSAGNNANLSLDMVSPSTPGTYSSGWRIKDEKGNLFGSELTITIIVPQPTNTPSPTSTFTLTPTPTLTLTPTPTSTATQALPTVEHFSQQIEIPGNSIDHTTVSCPTGSVVVSGGFAAQLDIRVYNSMKDGNGWQVYGRNRASTPKTLTVYAVCLAYPGASSTQVLEQANIAPNDQTNISTSCPSGSIVTGGGWIINADDAVELYNTSRDGNGWQIWVNNTGGGSPLVNVYAICLSGVPGSTESVLSSGTIPASDNGYVQSQCSAGQIATGGGFAIQLGPFIYNTSHRDNGWINYAMNNTGDDKVMYAYAICYSP